MSVSADITAELGLGYGSISAEHLSDQEASEFANQMKNYVVAADSSLPSSCIDGRRAVRLLSGEQTEPRPSIAGGNAISGWVAVELARASRPLGAKSSTERFFKVVDELEQKGLTVGGHCDSAATESDFIENKTGCGANDKIKDIVTNLAKRKSFIEKTSEILIDLDQKFDSGTMWKILNAAESLSKSHRLDDWQSTALISELKDSGSKIEVLESKHDATHGHHEQAVVFNYIEGTTIDRDRFVAETGKQVFVVDVWYLKKIAQSLGDDEASVKYFTHALVGYQLATYITLCDGSHRAIILK